MFIVMGVVCRFLFFSGAAEEIIRSAERSLAAAPLKNRTEKGRAGYKHGTPPGFGVTWIRFECTCACRRSALENR